MKDTLTGEKIEIKGVECLHRLLQSHTLDTIANKKGLYYAKDFGTFDIETTSLKDMGFMYLAALCIGEEVIFFRRWEEVIEAFDIIHDFYETEYKKQHYVVYVHYLPFEFQFMRNFFQWGKVFATEKRIVVSAVTIEGIEFRCSYRLTNMSLDKFTEKTKGVIHVKQDGKKFNYSKIRTPDTPIKSHELFYQYCDVKGLHEGIEILLEEDNLVTIPLTSTGYIRRECRKNMLKNPANRQLLLDSQLDDYMYLLLRTMRRGGDCAASEYYSSQVISNVDSYDIKSSYPYVMLTKKFPHGQWVEDSGRNILPDRAYIIIVEFYDISVVDQFTIGYIPVAKTLSKSNHINCNGRIIKADYVKLIINEDDLDIINSRYNYSEMKIFQCFSSPKDMLPYELREVIANWFYKKCQLIHDKYLYGKSKNKLNASFGMMLTDICHNEYLLKDGEWIEEVPNAQTALEKYYKSRNSFLLYQWGVWVTSGARKRLNEPYITGDTRKYAIYSDTDSWKLKHGYDKSIFESINAKIIADSDSYDIKPYAVDADGNIEYLGYWEHEATYDKFKTLGSKKYCYEIDGIPTVTVSGLSKEYGSAYLKKKGGIEKFNDNLVFPEKYSGRTVSVYDDTTEIRTLNVDGCTFTSSSSIAIHNTTYTLDRTGEYRSLIDSIQKYGIENIL